MKKRTQENKRWNSFMSGANVRGRSLAPTGQTPVGSTRQERSMIATVTTQGKTRWMIIYEAFSADKLIELVAALIKDAGRNMMMLEQNPMHVIN